MTVWGSSRFCAVTPILTFPRRGGRDLLEGFLGLRVDVEGAGEFQFVAYLADGGQDFLVH